MGINYHLASFQNSRNKFRSATVNIEETKGTASTTISEALAENLNRSSATFRNVGSSVIYVRAGTNTDVATYGMKVDAGESYEIDCSEAVFVQTASGTSEYRIAEGEG